MQRAAGVVDLQPVAKRIKRIALAGKQLLGHHQAVGHFGYAVLDRLHADEFELLIQETDVERRVVNDDLGVPQVFQQFFGHG